MDQFSRKYKRDIIGVLSGWDRVRFRGTIRMISYADGLLGWLNERRVLLKQFKPFVEDLTNTLRQSVTTVAEAAGKSVNYLASSAQSKEDLVADLIGRNGLREGLVCVLSCVEPCRSYEIHRNAKTRRLELVSRLRKCLHWYFYFLDPVLGLCHVRIQSWLPFTVHVCINGREWLCRQLDLAGIRYTRSDNCLLDVADVSAAQELLNSQPWADFHSMLNDLLECSCPAVLQLPLSDRFHEYYWSAAETEWATDVMFRSTAALECRYPLLIRHAMTTFSSRDVMRFLGRRRIPATGVDRRFNGQVVSDLRQRPEGLRVKHRMNRNSIKMYDKQGSVLRVETTINDARDLFVYRASEANPTGPKMQRRLRKGVVDLPRRAQISQAANKRYLTALAEADTSTPVGQLVDQLRAPVIKRGRRYRGLAPVSGPDATLSELLLRGEFSLNGFRNRDLRALLCPPTECSRERRRQSTRISRQLRLFREHGLIRKVKGTHRYHLTARGRRLLPVFIAVRHANSERITELAI